MVIKGDYGTLIELGSCWEGANVSRCRAEAPQKKIPTNFAPEIGVVLALLFALGEDNPVEVVVTKSVSLR